MGKIVGLMKFLFWAILMATIGNVLGTYYPLTIMIAILAGLLIFILGYSAGKTHKNSNED